jgi:hypothetical protein
MDTAVHVRLVTSALGASYALGGQDNWGRGRRCAAWVVQEDV